MPFERLCIEFAFTCAALNQLRSGIRLLNLRLRAELIIEIRRWLLCSATPYRSLLHAAATRGRILHGCLFRAEWIRHVLVEVVACSGAALLVHWRLVVHLLLLLWGWLPLLGSGSV